MNPNQGEDGVRFLHGRVILLTAGPALGVALLFSFFLGHRSDYLGHYAAGYGGTLCAALVALAVVPARKFISLHAWTIVGVTTACILGGAVTEATIFRLAKFDEVDFCNQSLGAVLAGMVALRLGRHSKPADAVLRVGLLVGIVYLLAGAYYALWAV